MQCYDSSFPSTGFSRTQIFSIRPKFIFADFDIMYILSYRGACHEGAIKKLYPGIALT